PPPTPRYTIQFLTADDAFVRPIAINDLGHITGEAGRYREISSLRQPFLWTPQSGYTFIPGLPGNGGYAFATALNNSDQVVGYSNGAGAPNAFLWSPSTGTRELPVPIGGAAGMPSGISDAGLVAINAQPRSYTWSQTTGPKFLPTLPGDTATSIAGVNKHGQILGFSAQNNVMWDRGN